MKKINENFEEIFGLPDDGIFSEKEIEEFIDEYIYTARKTYNDPDDVIAEVRRKWNELKRETDAKTHAASLLGSIKSEKKANSSRQNGKLGGRPKKN